MIENLLDRLFLFFAVGFVAGVLTRAIVRLDGHILQARRVGAMKDQSHRTWVAHAQGRTREYDMGGNHPVLRPQSKCCRQAGRLDSGPHDTYSKLFIDLTADGLAPSRNFTTSRIRVKSFPSSLMSRVASPSTTRKLGIGSTD